jgi:hypothetical protein
MADNTLLITCGQVVGQLKQLHSFRSLRVTDQVFGSCCYNTRRVQRYQQHFLDRGLLLTRKLLNQGFLLVKLKSSLLKVLPLICSTCRKHFLGYQRGDQNSHIEDNTMAKRKRTKGQTMIHKTYI